MRHLAIVCTSLVAAGSLTAAEAPGNPTEARAAAEAGNRFALDLYARLATGDGNIFFSPHSIHVALAMAWAGARGETAGEMARVLRIIPGSGVAGSFQALVAALNPAQEKGAETPYRLSVANSMWGQKGYPFEKPYLDLVRDAFGGELAEVDFETATEEARSRINGWVEDRTAKKIRDLIPAGLLLPTTRLVLANAIHMKSGWSEPFRKERTKDAPFRTGGRSVKVPLMHRTDGLRYFEGDGFQAVEIPYVQGALSMVVLLPAKPDGLPGLEKKVSSEALAGWIGRMEERPVILSLPRFKLTSSKGLGDVLKALGMAKAFRFGEADFTGISPSRELFIGEVLHKAYVDVDEEGTEAAAATAVVMLAGAAPAAKKPVEFKADRPFLFLIRHPATGAILFLGRLVDPAAK